MRIMKGFTLVELMISTFLGGVILATVTSLYSFSMESQNNQLKYSTLKSELDGLLFFMANEVKRAGYCGDCGATNPFGIVDISGAKSSILIANSATAINGSCIRFAYNEDSTQNLASVRDQDARGFRWIDSNNDGELEFEVYSNYSGLSNWDCNGSNWQDYNNQLVKITNLDFTRKTYYSASPGTTKSMQNITITIQGTIGAVSEQRTVSLSVANIDG